MRFCFSTWRELVGESEIGRILQPKTEIRDLKSDEIRGQARKADETSA